MTRLAVVVPCYNEEQVLPETIRQLDELLRRHIDEGLIDSGSQVYFIDDGSLDRTWALIETAAAANPLVKGIKLAHNRGHQFALLCGLMHAQGEVVLTVDADLQDDLGAIAGMLHAYRAGHDVVYGIRSRRDSDSIFKRVTARSYYRLLRWMGVDVVFDHADYRLMSRRAVETLRLYEETNIFLRGMVPLMGFPSATVRYERRERFAGESKYPLTKMLSLAIEGITSFTPFPLRFIASLGLLVTVLSLALGMWSIGIRLFTSSAIPGWASTVVPLYFLGGLQLLGIGVIGEYLSKVYLEVKRRPRYIIEKII